jgi:hypothetical protein
MREKAESLSDCKNTSSGLTKTLSHNMLFSPDDQTTHPLGEVGSSSLMADLKANL